MTLEQFIKSLTDEQCEFYLNQLDEAAKFAAEAAITAVAAEAAIVAVAAANAAAMYAAIAKKVRNGKI